MTQCQFIWNSYKKNICEGFSHLQQQEELVDMTLAAEGYLVKVHKSLLALASPYLKAIIQTAPYQHPIVFLTNIKQKILGYILEFVYTGEVALPSDDMANFIAACKSLHITGACDLIPPVQKKKVAERNYSNLNKQQNAHIEEEHCHDAQGTEMQPAQEQRLNENDDLEKYINHDQTKTLDLNKQNIVQTDVNNFIQNVDVIVPPIPVTNTYFSNISQSQEVVPQIVPKVAEKIDPERERELEIANAVTDLFVDNDMDIDDEVYDCDEGVTFEPLQSLSSTNMDNAESNSKNNYSINVEMPNDDQGPPKITIHTGVTENLPNVDDSSLLGRLQGIDEPINTIGDCIPKVTIQSNGKEINMTNDPAPNNLVQSVGTEVTSGITSSIPRITIDAGKIKDLPSASSAKIADTLPFASRARTRPKVEILPTNLSRNLASKIGNSPTPYYMLSSKGNMQMILNRYIYGLHYQSKQGKRKWRCIDYRHSHCPAYIDMVGEVIVKRQFAHNHPFHDEKIVQRGSSQKIFESLEDIISELKKRLESAEYPSKDFQSYAAD